MNTKNNQRAKATRARIESAFLDLLKKKDIDKISIQELCREADINRSTFYAHYQDIYDLFDKIEENMAKQTVDIFMDADTGEVREFNRFRYVELFQYMYENREFYLIYLSGTGQSHSITLHFTEYGRRMLQPLMEQADDKRRSILEYQIAYFNAGINAIIRRWIETGCVESPQEMAEMLATRSTFTLPI